MSWTGESSLIVSCALWLMNWSPCWRQESHKESGAGTTGTIETKITKMNTILRIIDETMESIMEMVREENDTDLAEETHALLNRMRRDIKEEL